MEITLEQAEALRKKADVTYEQARQLLEETGGDLLEALIRLERQGRIRPDGGQSAYYTTNPLGAGGAEGSVPPAGQSREEDPHRFRGLAVRVGEGKKRQDREASGGDRPGFSARLRELLEAALDLLRHATVNQFEVWRGEERLTSLPVLILILLLLLVFWISLPLLVVGLIMGCRYRFSGPDVDQNRAGQAANRAARAVEDAVDRVREEFRREWDRTRDKKGK